MSNFVDEPPTFKERFDSIEAVLAMQRRRLECIEDALGQVRASQDRHADDLKALKKAVGYILLGLAGQPVNVNAELLESLGFKTSPIIPASAVVKAS